MTIVAGREPMYDPRREIEQAVFNHFARGMADKKLSISLNQQQAIRLKVAEASRENRLLARLLARGANVHEEMDLVAAAKTAAVIELLDEVAYAASGEFSLAFDSIMAGPVEVLREEGITREQLAEVLAMRRRHVDLHEAWQAERLTPRELRIALVEYYLKDGRRKIDERFFGG